MLKPVILAILLLSLAGIVGSQPLTTNLPKSIEVVGNWINRGGDSKLKSRMIFIYLTENEFTVSNLSGIFMHYSREYCEPYILEIDVYTDKAELMKKSQYEKKVFAIDYKNSEVGQRAEAGFYERISPAATGYLRAEYSRYGNFEFFDYTKSKSDLADTRLNLDSKTEGKNGTSLRGPCVPKSP